MPSPGSSRAYNPAAVSRRQRGGHHAADAGHGARHGRRTAVDPAANIRGGTAYLRLLLDRFDGDVVRTVAAYNAGPGAVVRAGGIPRIPETVAYVAAVMDQSGGGGAVTGLTGMKAMRSIEHGGGAAGLLAPAGLAQAVTLDPAGSGAIVGALGWMQGTLLGNVATAVAVIAVASVGLLMLTGRIELALRRDGDPRAVHPVRRGRHRRRHPHRRRRSNRWPSRSPSSASRCSPR